MEVSWGTAAHNSSVCSSCEHKDGVATPAQLHLSTARGIFSTPRMGLDSQNPLLGALQPVSHCTQKKLHKSPPAH